MLFTIRLLDNAAVQEGVTTNLVDNVGTQLDPHDPDSHSDCRNASNNCRNVSCNCNSVYSAGVLLVSLTW